MADINDMDGGQPATAIDVNTASRTDLCRIPGMTGEIADAIIRYRDDRGGIDSLDELRDIEGMTEGDFAEFKIRLVVGSRRAAA